jgi:hypothetical protein
MRCIFNWLDTKFNQRCTHILVVPYNIQTLLCSLKSAKACLVTRWCGRVIAQAVSRRLPTAAARVQIRVWSCGILWWTKVAFRQVFSENFGLFPLPIYIPSASPQSCSLSLEAGTIGKEWPQCQ